MWQQTNAGGLRGRAVAHEWLKVPELLRVAHSRAYLRVADGEVRVVRIIHSVLVSRRELDRWMEGPRYKDVLANVDSQSAHRVGRPGASFALATRSPPDDTLCRP